MKYSKKNIITILFAWLTVFPRHVFAVDKLGDITDAVLHILGNIIPFFFAGVTLFFFWSVVIFVKSADNDEQRQKSKGAMVAGIIGLVVMLSIWGIVDVLGETFGVKGENASSEKFEDLMVDTPYN